METSPLISIVLPCYNSAPYLSECIQSIIAQNYSNWELIAIDDGSKDNTLLILEQFAKLDKRIKVFKNQENLHVAKTLNIGISLCKGSYIARMDADDVCYPTRLLTQLEYLLAHQDIDLIGMYAVSYTDGKTIRKPLSHAEIHAESLFTSPFIHPTLMWRVTVPVQYDPQFSGLEDWELWTRILSRYRGANITTCGIRYRRPLTSVTQTLNQAQLSKFAMVDKQLACDLKLCYFPECHALSRVSIYSSSSAKQFIHWIFILLKANLTANVYGQKALRKQAFLRILRIIKYNPKLLFVVIFTTLKYI